MSLTDTLVKYNIGGYTYLEIILFSYLMLVNFFTRDFYPLVPEVQITGQIVKFAVFVLIIASVLGYARFALGSNDYRYKLLYHQLPVFLGVISVAIYTGTISGHYKAEGFGIMDNIVPISIYNIIPGLLYILHAVQVQFKTSDIYTDKFNELTDSFLTGEMDARIEDEMVLKDQIFGRIGGFTNRILDSVETSITELMKNNNLMKEVAENLVSNSEEVNASVEEIAATSHAMSNGATTQTELINDVSEEIKQTTKLVDEIISNIRNNTNQVSQIALQTNILALNAGIEASRAGDYGRGFAVVAENIRKLSDQSKTASESISEVADEIAARLEEAFSKISATMLNVVSVSEETAASAEEVASSTSEMTGSMEEISVMAEKLASLK